MLNGFQSAGMYIQARIFGLGPNSSLNQFVGRVDTSIQLMWQFEGFGIGNLARIKKQRGEQSRAIIELLPCPGHGGGGSEPRPRRISSRRRPGSARPIVPCERASSRSTGTSRASARRPDLENVLVMVYRPQEAVYSLELLKMAFDEYFTTVADYNRAQFELFHALGYPAGEIANRRPAGDVELVDTNRPLYLPPVGNGPPPATR